MICLNALCILYTYITVQNWWRHDWFLVLGATCWPPLRGLMKKEHLVIPDIIGYVYYINIIKITCMYSETVSSILCHGWSMHRFSLQFSGNEGRSVWLHDAKELIDNWIPDVLFVVVDVWDESLTLGRTPHQNPFPNNVYLVSWITLAISR